MPQLLIVDDEKPTREGLRAALEERFDVYLAEDAKAHIHVDVPVRDARWLRTSSVFTLERGLVGGARIRAFTGVLDAPPLPPGARRDLLIGDAAERIPQVLAGMQQLLANLEKLSAADAPLAATLANMQAVSGAMTGRYGVLGGVLGSERDAARVIEALERTNRLLAETNARLYGKDGLADEAQRTAAEARAMLSEARVSLQKVNAALVDLGKVAANARGATDDLDVLRSEVETSLRRISGLVEEINRKWPFARERELKLP